MYTKREHRWSQLKLLTLNAVADYDGQLGNEVN
jgi:hypothetical protein